MLPKGGAFDWEMAILCTFLRRLPACPIIEHYRTPFSPDTWGALAAKKRAKAPRRARVGNDSRAKPRTWNIPTRAGAQPVSGLGAPRHPARRARGQRPFGRSGFYRRRRARCPECSRPRRRPLVRRVAPPPGAEGRRRECQKCPPRRRRTFAPRFFCPLPRRRRSRTGWPLAAGLARARSLRSPRRFFCSLPRQNLGLVRRRRFARRDRCGPRASRRRAGGRRSPRPTRSKPCWRTAQTPNSLLSGSPTPCWRAGSAGRSPSRCWPPRSCIHRCAPPAGGRIRAIPAGRKPVVPPMRSQRRRPATCMPSSAAVPQNFWPRSRSCAPKGRMPLSKLCWPKTP